MNTLVEKIGQTYRGQRRYVGMFVGQVVEGKIRIGWSRCNLADGDVFNVNRGIAEAVRHLRNNEPIKPLTHKWRNTDFMMKYGKFRARCAKYFQGYEFATEANQNVETPQVQATVDQLMSEIEANGAKGLVPRQLVVDVVNPLLKIGNVLWNRGAVGCLVKAKVMFTQDGIKIEKQDFTQAEKDAVQPQFRTIIQDA